MRMTVGAAAISVATVAYPASMNSYLSVTDAPLRSTPVGSPGGISPPGSRENPGVTLSRHRALLILLTRNPSIPPASARKA